MKNQGFCWFWESRDFHIRNHVKQKSGASVYCQVALDTNYCFLRHPKICFSLVSMMEKRACSWNSAGRNRVVGGRSECQHDV
jgi:hypothetical protein